LDSVVMAWVKTIFFTPQQQLAKSGGGKPTFQQAEPSPEVAEYR
jgi:hypothetical protein